MTTREDLYHLVSTLTDDELDAARRLLEYFHSQQDPLVRSLLTALPDDEPESEEERRAVAEAKSAYETGDWKSLDQIRQELGQ